MLFSINLHVYILKVVNKRQAPTSSPTFKSGKSFQMAGNSSHDDFADTNNESIKKSKVNFIER